MKFLLRVLVQGLYINKHIKKDATVKNNPVISFINRCIYSYNSIEEVQESSLHHARVTQHINNDQYYDLFQSKNNGGLYNKEIRDDLLEIMIGSTNVETFKRLVQLFNDTPSNYSSCSNILYIRTIVKRHDNTFQSISNIVCAFQIPIPIIRKPDEEQKKLLEEHQLQQHQRQQEVQPNKYFPLLDTEACGINSSSNFEELIEKISLDDDYHIDYEQFSWLKQFHPSRRFKLVKAIVNDNDLMYD